MSPSTPAAAFAPQADQPARLVTLSSHCPVSPAPNRASAIVRLAVALLAILGAVATIGVAGTGTAAAASVERGRVADPVAEQAALALSLWRQYETSGDAATLAAYTSQRDAVATSIAGRVLVDAPTMQQAWAAADTEHQEALLAGLTQLGVPYRRNTSKEGEGFDCSGLTTYAWGQAGFVLTRQSTTQIRRAAPRTFDTAQAGDLVQYPGHVMLWLGVGKTILHSPYPGRNVEVDTLSSRHSLKIGDPTG